MADMRTADRHAALAADAGQLTDVRLHLQHVLNCLEGQQGPDYYSAAENPGSGAGVIHELPVKSVNRIRVNKAIRLAAIEITFRDLKPAQAMLNEGIQ